MPCAGVKYKTGCKASVRNLLLYPLTYIRLLALVCSIVVFSCVADQLYNSQSDRCVYNSNNSCCKYDLAVGVIGCGLCLIFVTKDIFYVVLNFSEHPRLHATLLVTDCVINGMCAVLWFAAFVLTSDQWRKTPTAFAASINNCANGGVAFSFLSTLLWIAIVIGNVIPLIRTRRGYGLRSGYDPIG
ncbi:hypothetical protein EMCRGX_G028055 [Ephydatia muelleri]